MARPHLTQTTPFLQLTGKFISFFEKLATSCRNGELTVRPTETYLQITYVSKNQDLSCGCTVRRKIGNKDDLEVIMRLKSKLSFEKEHTETIESLQDAETRLHRAITRIENDLEVPHGWVYKDIFPNTQLTQPQPTTAAESISDIKKKLDRLMEESETLKTVADKVYSAFANAPEAKGSNKTRPEANGNSMIIEFRHWGEWEIPPGEEDDGDYDWRQPTEKTYQAAKKIISDLSSKYPDFKIDMSAEEKDYLVITVSQS